MPNNLNQTDRKHAIIIILAFAAIYIIWGTTYFAIRVAVQTIPPFFMAAARFLFSGMLIFIILRLRGVPLPKRFHWRSAVIVGALLLVGGNGLVTWSEQQVPSSTAALVVATVPLWIALFDWLIFQRNTAGKTGNDWLDTGPFWHQPAHRAGANFGNGRLQLDRPADLIAGSHIVEPGLALLPPGKPAGEHLHGHGHGDAGRRRAAIAGRAVHR